MVWDCYSGHTNSVGDQGSELRRNSDNVLSFPASCMSKNGAEFVYFVKNCVFISNIIEQISNL